MPHLVDGNLSVAEIRGEGWEDAIADIVGLSVGTVRNRLREAHGRTKLSNVFSEYWPDRLDEVGCWTAAYAREREAAHEIAEYVGLSQRAVDRRLEEARGNTLVQNVFGLEWPTGDDQSSTDLDVSDVTDKASKQLGSSQIAALRSVLPDEPEAAELGPPSLMFRSYVLRAARATRARREPAAHQTEALKRLHAWFRSEPVGHRGGVLALPTGGGKTFTCVRFLCQAPLSDGYKVLWLAHTHHLLEQAIDAFGPIDVDTQQPLEVAHITEPREQLDVRVVSATPGHFPVSEISSSDDVVIATLQTVVAALDRGHKNLLSFLDSSNGKFIVVFDEAHHAPAPSYRKLLERLRTAYPAMYLLGLTATPTYSNEQKQGWLKKLFPQDVLATVSRTHLIAAGILSRPHFEDARTDVAVGFDDGEFQRWAASSGDLPEHIVSTLAENQARNDFIAQTYVAGRERYGKTLVFADRWYQCDYLREALIKRGVRADVVYSHVDAKLPTADARNRRSKDENARVLAGFRDDKLDVLINVRMLTEGTDVPSVQTVFLTRQTTSTVLLTQMIGRALRGPAFGGTPDAFIVSFIDNWAQVISFAEFETLPVKQADDSEREYGRRPPLQLISIELVRQLARQMYGGSAGAPASFLTLLPIGWYRTEFETRVPGTDDVVWSRSLVMVFANEKERYESFIRSAASLDISPFASETLVLDEVRSGFAAWRDKHFAANGEHPGSDLTVDLFGIVRHMAQNDGQAPTFFPFEERAAHDIDAIAEECIEHNVGLRDLSQKLRFEYERLDRFWRALYPNYDSFYAQCQASIRRDRSVGADPNHGKVIQTPQAVPFREPSDAVKAAVKRRDGNRCLCCGATANLEIDHIISVYLGGSNQFEQLQTLCRTCNQDKSINELNFRTANTPLTLAPIYVPVTTPQSELSDDTVWLAYIQRSVNFFYRCAATDACSVSNSDNSVRLTLRPGLDPKWIERHVPTIREVVNQGRRGGALKPLSALHVVGTE